MSLRKFLGLDKSKSVEEPVLSNPNNQEVPVSRLGMFRNFRVGKITYIPKDRRHVLVNVLEETRIDNDPNGSKGVNYNLWLEVDSKYQHYINDLAVVGQWALWGYYTQAFRSEDDYKTICKIRFYNPLSNESEAKSMARLIMDSITPIDNPRFYYSDLNAKKDNKSDLPQE